MTFNQTTIDSINEKLSEGNHLYLRTSCDGHTHVIDEEWRTSLCSVEKITQMIEGLKELRNAIEETSGVIL